MESPHGREKYSGCTWQKGEEEGEEGGGTEAKRVALAMCRWAMSLVGRNFRSSELSTHGLGLILTSC